MPSQERQTENSDGGVGVAQFADEGTAFAAMAAEYRRELLLHCYRMVGSLEDSEDLVQEALLRAWRFRASYRGEATQRTWLYSIATNACLDFLARSPRRPRTISAASIAGATEASGSQTEIPWLQPFPDALMNTREAGGADPEGAAVAKETVELAFMVAIQHLPPRQRAVFIFRDVLGFPAKETARHLELSLASVTSSLQRARATVRRHLPPRRLEWAAPDPAEAEQILLTRYIRAFEGGDTVAMAELLHEDLRSAMPMLFPCDTGGPETWLGRAAFTARLREVFDPASASYLGEFQSMATRANQQPAVAHFVRRDPAGAYEALVLDVLRVVDGRIAEIMSFPAAVFGSFDLPATLAADSR